MKALVLWDSNRKSRYSMSTVLLDGYVLFKQENPGEECHVFVYLKGLPEGKHGFHIHEKGFQDIENCSDIEDCCKELGGHFSVDEKWSLSNLNGTKHGQHEGDLSFNIISENGLARHQFKFKNISLFQNKYNIMNRSIVIHKDEDDMGLAFYEDDEKNIESLITGNAGERIACGEIREFKG
jgi:Cu-Zn family superoxide dismutase